MINLNIKLEINTNYINSGNSFSKNILLKNILKKEKSSLTIVENEKLINNYIKISSFLWFKFKKINSLSDLVELIYNKNWHFISNTDLFRIKFKNIKQIEYNDIFIIEKTKEIQIKEITKKLNEFNYKFWEFEENNSFFVKWDILSIKNSLWETYSISFWWNTIEDISLTSTSSNKRMIKSEGLEKIYIWNNKRLNFVKLELYNNTIKELIIKNNIFTILDNIDFDNNYDNISKDLNNYIILNTLLNNKFAKDLEIKDLFINNIEELKNILWNNEKNIYIITKNTNTINNFLNLNNFWNITVIDSKLNILKSFQTSQLLFFSWNNKNKENIFICDDNISRIFIKKRLKRKISKNLDLLMQIKPWDFIVHIDHWIWVFDEIIEKELPSSDRRSTKGLKFIKKEYISIKYKNNDKLFVPITEISRVSKYVWMNNPKLTWLSTNEWERKIKKAQNNIEEIANELLEFYAKRKLKKGFAFESLEKEENKFLNSFEFVYTNDQLSIIKEIYKDMESKQPMDRLLSWDVGFWKTEIAFATIYKAIINKKQAAFIAPLVVLAYEHYEKAKERFRSFWIKIEVLTRFESQKSIKNTLVSLKKWEIDLIIWTHRLLSEDILFKDLWLLVIDEEHKFWVGDKEKINKFKENIDILSMSATPIPRSLNMALNWIKSISMLTTPPVWKQAISTIVAPFNNDTIISGIKKEFGRDWQVFFIHNRVETIWVIEKYLKDLFPKKRILITHWQLPWDTLEKRIIEFKRWQADILLSTTVIENWIDFGNVNTIFINDAQNFWISQIHQLRWRVWRKNKKWVCYLLFRKDKIKEDAVKRLKTIVEYSHLWAWFELAIKDLEARGSWDILWIKQSWQSSEIGINLFLQMLESKIEELKNSKKSKGTGTESFLNIKTKIDLNIWAYIDDNFFTSELDKINFYREIESLNNLKELDILIKDFKEINKNIPNETQNFFDLLKLKIYAHNYKICTIKKVWINYQIEFNSSWKLREEWEKTLNILKEFLKLDKEVKFNIVNLTKIRSQNKNFENEEKFIKYLLLIFEKKIKKVKIKLKKSL